MAYDTAKLDRYVRRVLFDKPDHVIVLDYGEKIAEGVPLAVQSNPRVIAAYLGEDVDESDESDESDEASRDDATGGHHG